MATAPTARDQTRTANTKQTEETAQGTGKPPQTQLRPQVDTESGL